VRVLGALLLAVGCASAPRVQPFTIAEARWVEARELPPNPRDEPLPGDVPTDSDETFVAPYEPGAGDNPTVPGLVVSEARATRDALFRIRYDELRKLYQADRSVWEVHRETYELRLKLAGDRIVELQPSWWQENGVQVIGIFGFVLGVSATVGIAGALP